MRSALIRRLEIEVGEALRKFPAVIIVGARQTGKSTLVRGVGGEARTYLTFDDLNALSAALRDPAGFIAGIKTPATIDEAQRVPGLLLAIKKVIDSDRIPGKFLLTGSSTFGPLDRAGETLAGRAAVLRLRLLTMSEMSGNPHWNPLDVLLEASGTEQVVSAFAGSTAPRLDAGRLLIGGFPEPSLNLAPEDRASWFEQYRRTYVERDVPRLVSIAEVAAFTSFVGMIAGETAHVLNLSAVSREIGVSVDTCRRWLGVLQATFLLESLPAFARSARKRLARSPKIHWTDPGLCAHLAGARDALDLDRLNLRGALTESFVHAHVASFAESLDGSCRLFHYRPHGGAEADMILEGRGKWVPIEVKAGATISTADSKGIESFIGEHPEKAPFGVLLYNGSETVPLSRTCAAIPIGVFLGATARS